MPRNTVGMQGCTEVCTGPACAGDLWAMKGMSPCGCMPGCSQGEPTQMHIWDGNRLAWASSSVPCKSSKLIFLVVSTVFPWKAILCVVLKCGNQIEEKNTRGGKNFPMNFLSSAKSFYIQPPSGQVFKGMSWHGRAGEGEKQFSYKCFHIHLSIPQKIT